MRGNRSRDTKPELAVRRRLFAAGLRYRVAHRPEPGLRRTADIVFASARVAVFVDGCFWHGCPEHFVAAKTNTRYWDEKVRINMARDSETDAKLRSLGWEVLRYWSHEDPAVVAAEVETAVRSRRRG
jgi:DNA mismatch endonuclease (patch repair protein)